MDAELVAWRERVRGCESVQLLAELQQLARRDRRCEVRILSWKLRVLRARRWGEVATGWR
jgi:hypothetical protein